MSWNRGTIAPIPQTFAESIAQVQAFVLQEFDREITQKQLYYHTRLHVDGVRDRATLIFQTIQPAWEASLDQQPGSGYLARMHHLLDLCAVAHDMLQIFVPHQPHTSRRRESGVSETATAERLLEYIQVLNQQLQTAGVDPSAQFTEADFALIREAIAATICEYDPGDRAIFQPALYTSQPPISPISRILALADLGALGIEGIAAYNREGQLLFLEENPNVISFIQGHSVGDHPDLEENIRQRLLKRARFQVNLAKSRLARYPQEVAGLPASTIPTLTGEVFRYLRPEIIHEIEVTTPTEDNTPLQTLIEFFQLDSLTLNSIMGNEL